MDNSPTTRKEKKVKAWVVLKDLNTGEYRDIDYLCGYPRIFLQKTKPVVKQEGKSLPVVPCTITYTPINLYRREI